jgi:hypothetical protein
MKRVLSLLLVLTALLVFGLTVSVRPLLAHHGRGNTYDTSQEIEVQGVVNAVLWRNPHIGILLDVEDEDGNVDTWSIEHSNVSTLARMGYGRNTVRAGMEVTAVINPGEGGRKVGLCRKIILADGTEVFQRGALGPLD